jgi:translation initiation factor IF-2
MNNGKVRIYELSRELNLDNKDLLAVCEQLNISVKSHSSTITDSEAERIRAEAEKQVGSLSASKPQVRQGANSSNSESKHSESKTRVPAPIQKKQQILEIRKPTIRPVSPEPSTPPKREVAETTTVQPSPAANLLSAPARPHRQEAKVQEAKVSLASPPEAAIAPSLPPVESPAIALSLPPVESPAIVESHPTVETALPEAEVSVELQAPTEAEPKAPVEPKAPARSRVAKPPTPIPEAIQPELVEPPARPSADPAIAKSSTSTSTNRPVLKRVQAEQVAQIVKSPAKSADKSDAPRETSQRPTGPAKAAPTKSPIAAKATEGRPAPKPQTFVELRRPKPARSEEDLLPKEEAFRNGDIPRAIEPLVLLKDRPKQPVPGEGAVPGEVQLLKPSPPSRTKKKNWEEEEEIVESPDKAKLAKAKRRLQPSLDEDEDLEDLDGDGDGSEDTAMQVNLSLVRPAKPKSMRQPQAKPTVAVIAAPKAKKSSSSFRDRRDRREEVKPEKPEKIVITGSLTVQELALMLIVAETDIIRTLFMEGIAATVTQTLDIPMIKMVAEKFEIGVETEEKASEARKVIEMLNADDLENLERRPPVVTIMGHVDHGKTTLLDSIRKTKVAQGEAGGITQHIGAYHVDVEHNGEMQKVVFLDTPGHEAFTAMRARGARVTDVAILVVAADDGVQPQTVEAISHAKAAEVPIIIAINKIDKEEAQPDRVKQELTEYGLVPEEWGGETIMVPVSAITGDNLDTLLEMILLVSEVEDLYANPDRPAKGTVIEAHLDKAKGPVATLLIQNGTLKVGDTLVAGSALGKVRAMVNDRGERVKVATPSFAVEVLGLSDVPAAGDEFDVFEDEKEARATASSRTDEQRQSRLLQAMSSRRVSLNTLSARAQEGDLKELNLVLKADVQGSVEAILGALKQLPQNEVQVRVLYAAPGEVTETDVDLAAASDAVIIGFNTTLATGARQAADQAGVDVRDYNIIYKLLDDIQAAMEGLLEPELVEETLGQVEVRAVFPVGRGAVAGCYVQSGKVIRNCKIRVRRDGTLVHEGNLDSLKRMKEDAREVNAGYECGVGVDSFTEWQIGDIIEGYRMIAKRRTLSPK